MRIRFIAFVFVLLGGTAAQVAAADQQFDYSGTEGLLPPVQPWSGKSEALIATADDPWISPAERTGLMTTPDYEETMVWLQKLVTAAPELELISLGKSLQGRDFFSKPNNMRTKLGAFGTGIARIELPASNLQDLRWSNRTSRFSYLTVKMQYGS